MIICEKCKKNSIKMGTGGNPMPLNSENYCEMTSFMLVARPASP